MHTTSHEQATSSEAEAGAIAKTASKQRHSDAYAVIMFDGVCNLCNASVNFVIDRDKDRYFRYAPLQSDTGRAFLEEHGHHVQNLDSVILAEGQTYYTKSTAALRIARRLSGAWPLLYGFIIVPPFIRNAVYDFIASKRYAWFGRQDACRMPEPELKSLFLN